MNEFSRLLIGQQKIILFSYWLKSRPIISDISDVCIDKVFAGTHVTFKQKIIKTLEIRNHRNVLKTVCGGVKVSLFFGMILYWFQMKRHMSYLLSRFVIGHMVMRFLWSHLIGQMFGLKGDWQKSLMIWLQCSMQSFSWDFFEFKCINLSTNKSIK